MLEETKTEERVARHKVSLEDFTPRCVVEKLYEGLDELFTNFDKTLCDPCAGIFYILMYCFEKRLDHCKTASDILSAISTIYGTELFEDNVNEGKQNLINMLEDFISNNTIKFTKTDMNKFMKILDNNFKCTDTFKWDYDHWCPMKEDKCDALF